MEQKNKTSTFVIGDVHGCFHTMKKLIEKLPLDSRIIFVGDLCDKGNFSKEVIEYVIENNYECVKGNHEHLMETYLQDAIDKNIHSPWSSDYRYGGIQTYDGYLNDRETMLKHLEWLSTLPTYIEVENYFITHGFGLPFYQHKDDNTYYNEFLLSRYEKGVHYPHNDVINIFGHCVFEEVVCGANFYGIDTGCSYGNKLTALELGSNKIIQEPMMALDSNYQITEIKLEDMHPKIIESTLDSVIDHIDTIFSEFDLVSNEVLEFIASNYLNEGMVAIENMLEKKQIFPKQISRIIKKFEKDMP